MWVMVFGNCGCMRYNELLHIFLELNEANSFNLKLSLIKV